MTRFSCENCGTQYGDSSAPPGACMICDDEREYVGWSGQRWTTQAELRETHRIRIEPYRGMIALKMEPAFAIDQRALLLPTDAGNILWESLSLVTQDAVDELRRAGGVDMIAISHPHFYGAMVEWSNALGGIPILLHGADRRWVARADGNIEFWGDADRLKLSQDVTLIQCGGHFEGSTALHWARGPAEGGALFPGDALQVTQDRQYVSFMYSYPNLIPLRRSAVEVMRDRLADLAFEDVYGYAWARDIIGDGRQAVDRSFVRYLAAIDPAA
jgi:hypothetical protein